ncbi:hypothetical protein RhiirA4_489516, partial [Rhizophagus irregularis]
SLFDKTPSKPVDKAQLLIDRFGEAADPANFSLQAQATNIQPTTSLYYSLQRSMCRPDMGDLEDSDTDDELGEASAHALNKDEIHRIIDAKLSNLGLQTPNPVEDTPPILPDVEMTPVDQTVIPENSQKKDKQKARTKSS